MFRYCTIYIFLFATAIVASAQSTALADSLSAAGCYERAAVEYERCAYRSLSLDEQRHALQQKAGCEKAVGRYAAAAHTIGRYAYSAADYYQQALCHYLASDLDAATASLDHARLLADTLREDILLLQVLTLNAMQQFDSARQVASLLADTYRRSSGIDIAPLLDSLYALRPAMKSERTAWWLSFIPGLGHFYAGEYAVGSAAFLLNAAVLGFGIWQVFERCYITAYVGGAGLLSATYLGAMRSAEHYVRKRNHDRTAAFDTLFREHLLDSFQQKKSSD